MTISRVYFEMLTPTGGAGVFTPGAALQNGDRIYFDIVGNSVGLNAPPCVGAWTGQPPVPTVFSDPPPAYGGVFGPGTNTVGAGPPPATFPFTYTGTDPVVVLMAYRGVSLFDPGGIPPAASGSTKECPVSPLNSTLFAIGDPTWNFGKFVMVSMRGGSAAFPVGGTGNVNFPPGFMQLGKRGNGVLEMAVAERGFINAGHYEYDPSDIWTPENCIKTVHLFAMNPNSPPSVVGCSPDAV